MQNYKWRYPGNSTTARSMVLPSTDREPPRTGQQQFFIRALVALYMGFLSMIVLHLFFFWCLYKVVIPALQKHAYSNMLKILKPKKGFFSDEKNLIFFIFLLKT